MTWVYLVGSAIVIAVVQQRQRHPAHFSPVFLSGEALHFIFTIDLAFDLQGPLEGWRECSGELDCTR